VLEVCDAARQIPVLIVDDAELDATMFQDRAGLSRELRHEPFFEARTSAFTISTIRAIRRLPSL
jgi:hypothetical protein